MNVLMINTLHSGGGAGRASERLATALRAAGHNVRALVARNLRNDPSCRVARHWRLDAPGPALHRRGLPDLGHCSSLLWRLLPEFAAADVIHLHNLHGGFMSLAALPVWAADKPLVWTWHDQWPVSGNCVYSYDCTRWQRGCGHCPRLGEYALTRHETTRCCRWLKVRLVRAARPRLITPSRWLASMAAQVPQYRRLPVCTIPYAVPTDLFAPPADRAAARRALGLRPDAPTIVFACHSFNDRRKGVDDAVAACRALRGRVGGAQLLALGSDSQKFLRASGLPGVAVPFLLDEAAVARAFGAADAALTPSHADNYPYVVLEALACGTPVVAYAVGGIVEQLEHRRSGWLARDGDVGGLVDGLTWLLRSRETARACGQRGRRFVAGHCAPAAVAARHLDEYAQALAAWRLRTGRATPRRPRSSLARRLCRWLGWNDIPSEPLRRPTPVGAPGQVAPELCSSISVAQRAASGGPTGVGASTPTRQGEYACVSW